MIVKSQHGQSVVEFAIILPLLFFVCGAMLVLSMIFIDYVRLQNSAQTFARAISHNYSTEANESVVRAQIVRDYASIHNDKTTLPLFLYHCDISNTSDMVLIPTKPATETDGIGNGYWTVRLTAGAQNTNTGLWTLSGGLISHTIGPIRVTSTMYSEKNPSETVSETNSNGT